MVTRATGKGCSGQGVSPGSRARPVSSALSGPIKAKAAFRERHDGWTAERRARFLEMLALTGCVRDACNAIRLSSTSAYRTRALLPDFADAWAEALASARVGLEAAAYRRAVQGVDVPIVHRGEVVATRRKYSDSLLALLLKRGDMRDEAEAARIAAEVAIEVDEERQPTEQGIGMLRTMLDEISARTIEDEHAEGRCSRCGAALGGDWQGP